MALHISTLFGTLVYFATLFRTFLYCIALFYILVHFVALLLTKYETNILTFIYCKIIIYNY